MPAPPPGRTAVVWAVGGDRGAGAHAAAARAVFGFMPVVPMVLVSALLMFVVSLLTRKPARATIAKYFPEKQTA